MDERDGDTPSIGAVVSHAPGVPPEHASLARLVRDGRLRPESYPGEWDDRRRAARRRHLRRGFSGWAAALAVVAVGACTTSVAVTAGGLVGYAGYSIYRLAEAGRSWSTAATEFLFTAKPKPEASPSIEPKTDGKPDCSWTERLRRAC